MKNSVKTGYICFRLCVLNFNTNAPHWGKEIVLIDMHFKTTVKVKYFVVRISDCYMFYHNFV